MVGVVGPVTLLVSLLGIGLFVGSVSACVLLLWHCAPAPMRRRLATVRAVTSTTTPAAVARVLEKVRGGPVEKLDVGVRSYGNVATVYRGDGVDVSFFRRVLADVGGADADLEHLLRDESMSEACGALETGTWDEATHEVNYGTPYAVVSAAGVAYSVVCVLDGTVGIVRHTTRHPCRVVSGRLFVVTLVSASDAAEPVVWRDEGECDA